MKHPRYNRIAGYQQIAGLSNDACASHLGIATRTYREKVDGIRDFTVTELLSLAKLLGRTTDELLTTA